MSKYNLLPEEATPEMEQAAERYWNERKFKALSDDPRTWKGLYAAMRAAAPAVQGEPEAWVTANTVDGQTVNGKPRRIWWENNEGVGIPIYTASPPAPDVSALVAALEELVDLVEDIRQGEYIPDSFTTQPARIALAAHRKPSAPCCGDPGDCTRPCASPSPLHGAHGTIAYAASGEIAPAPGSRWRHRGGMSEYRVEAVANLHSTREEYPPTVVFSEVNGRMWCRPLSSWARSMTPIPARREA